MDRFVSNVSGDAHNAELSSRDASGLDSFNFVPTGRISSHREGDDTFGAGLDYTGEYVDLGPNDHGQDE